MKHISLLIPKGDVSLSNIDGTYKVFSTVNDFLSGMGKQPLFNISLVGHSREMRPDRGFFTIHPDLTFSEVKQTDLIVIPATHGELNRVVFENQDFVPWIRKQYKSGSEIASLCIGAFILASTGLLKGRQCATHYLVAEQFRAMFPDVNLVTDKIITDESGIYTSGGAFSFLNLLLYLVEKYAGRDATIYVSKIFQVDIDRDSQSPFTIFKGQKAHMDEPVKRAQEFIEQNFEDKITVDQLASMLALGRRNLERRFKKATANTVVEYIQRVKIEAAKMSLESSRENVNEVMYNIGYSDTKAFRNTFKKITGLSPVQYRNKYNREAQV